MATAFMSLSLPTVTVTTGPEWASQLNSALELIDSHDHSSGKGTKVTPSGLNMNSDLEMNDNNLTEVKSSRFENQDAELAGINDLRCLYVSGNNLYYNTENGTAVQITSGTGLNAASIGGIGGDYGSSSASVAYSSANQTFSFTQSSGIAAHIDIGNLVVRQATASSNGITIKSPNSLGSAYALTLPTGLPASGETKILTVDSSGQIGAAYDTDNSTLEVSSNSIRIKDLGVTAAKLAVDSVTAEKVADDAIATDSIQDGAVTPAKRGAANYTLSSASGAAVVSSTSFTDITNLSATITTNGRPVLVKLVSSGGTDGDASRITYTGTEVRAYIRLLKDGVESQVDLISAGESAANTTSVPPNGFEWFDAPSAGTYTYKLQARCLFGSTSIHFRYCKLLVMEI